MTRYKQIRVMLVVSVVAVIALIGFGLFLKPDANALPDEERRALETLEADGFLNAVDDEGEQISNIQQACDIADIECQGGHVVELTLAAPAHATVSLPTEVGDFSQLDALSIHGTTGSTLVTPDSVANLQKLTTFKLVGIVFSEVPPAMQGLPSLRRLLIWEADLPKMPDGITTLTHLDELAVGSSGLTGLPPNLSNLSNLRILNLGGNHVTQLPAELTEMNKLTHLTLWNNGLTDLPQAVASISSLESLDLSDNELTTLPADLVEMPNLSAIDLSGNGCISVDEALATKLNTISPGWNQGC